MTEYIDHPSSTRRGVNKVASPYKASTEPRDYDGPWFLRGYKIDSTSSSPDSSKHSSPSSSPDSWKHSFPLPSPSSRIQNQRRPPPSSPPPFNSKERGSPPLQPPRSPHQRQFLPLPPPRSPNERRSTSQPHSSLSPINSRGVQASWSAESTQNVTLHLALDHEEDFESYHEELCRLKRLGKFDAARKYFDSCREYSSYHPSLLLDYTDTLLRQGAFGFLDDLIVNKRLQDLIIVGRNPSHLQNRYFRSIYHVARVYSLGWLERALNLGWRQDNQTNFELERDFAELTPIQVQLLCHLMYLDSAAYRFTQILQHGEFDGLMMCRWDHLYKHLTTTGRIWDVRDLFLASLSSYGARITLKNFLYWQPLVKSSALAQRLVEDCTNGGGESESTYLAILDILVALSLRLVSHDGKVHEPTENLIAEFMVQARRFATMARLSNPDNTKSSPYLWWILAEERLATDLQSRGNFSYLEQFPGIVVWLNNLPIYVPESTENPGWSVGLPSESSQDLLNLGLAASRELGDYCLEAKYLEELARRSGNPQTVLHKLIHLQKYIQRDRYGYLRTCLTRYLLATDYNSRESLMIDLSEFDSQEIPSGRCGDAVTRWCQRKIQKALCLALGEPQEQQNFYSRLEVSAYTELPKRFKETFSDGRKFGTNFCIGDATGLRWDSQSFSERDIYPSEAEGNNIPEAMNAAAQGSRFQSPVPYRRPTIIPPTLDLKPIEFGKE